MTQVLRPLVEARIIREPRPVNPSTMTFGKPVPTVVHTVPAPCVASPVRKTPTSVATNTVLGNCGSTRMLFAGAFGSAVPPVPEMSCQVVPPSLVRKTWPMLSRQNVQPENPEKATYTMSGSLRSTPMELIVRPVGRVAAFVRSVQAGELESAFVVLWILLVVPNASVPT